mgnify:CR=1 FL=1
MLAIEESLQVLLPREQVRIIRWAMHEAFTEHGHPYSDFAFPHIGAPGGPFDAADCHLYFDQWLQWGSRLGKTYGGQVVSLKNADCDPSPGMFASSNEKLATDVIQRTYAMIRHSPRLSPRLPKVTKQSSVDLGLCRIHVAWARSVSTLADKAVRIGHANEIDKWEHLATSKEADPLKLFDERFKEFVTFNRWKEGTPTEKGRSRIEAGRLASCNASYWVGCPHCGRYQVLRKGDGSKPGGIVWSKNEAGKSTVDLALKSARYICLHCEQEILDEHRGAMMREGVWIPEGCGCDDDKARDTARAWRDREQLWGGWSDAPWITGDPLRDGSSWGSQLSSLYALSLSWGKLASEWVDCEKKPQKQRNYINSWLAETWEIASRKETWEKIGERLTDHGAPRGVVPVWASLLTVGVDRQGRDGGKFPWIVLAWGPGHRCHVVSYGEEDTFDQVEARVLKVAYPHADGGKPLGISYTLCDSGYRPDGVYEFCVRMIGQGFEVWPAKGSNTAMNSDWTRTELGKNTSMPGMGLIMVDTIRSQLWIENRIFDTSEPRNTTIHAGSVGEHQDFLEQILNDAPVDELDKHNNARESWQRINESLPNDYRDVWRYAWVAMLIAQGGREPLPRRYTPPPPRPEDTQTPRIRELRIRR